MALTIADIKQKPAGWLIQDPITVTIRQAYPPETKPSTYPDKNGNPGTYTSQGLTVSDDTGTMKLYVTDAREALNQGEQITICCTKNNKNQMTGAGVKHNGRGEAYINVYPSGYRLSGVRREQASVPEDPWFMQNQPQQQQGQSAPPARPQQARLPLPAQPSGGRTSREMEEWLLGVTERLFVGLSDGLTNSAPEGARLECSQSMAVALMIGVARGEIDYIPESKPAPSSLPERPMQEAPPFEGGEDGNSLDWGDFGGEYEFKS
jgi:hypothetical protein